MVGDLGWSVQSRDSLGPMLAMARGNNKTTAMLWFSSGKIASYFQGGGWLTAIVDSNGVFSGSQVAFVYSDLETALVGSWEEGSMVAASPAILTSVNLVAGILEPTFTIECGRPTVGLSISTETSVGASPLIGDPYEGRVCKVEVSKVEGGGEGLYALRDLRPGEVDEFL